MSRLDLPMFVWFPLNRTTKYKINIKGTNVRDDVISAKFTRGIIGEENSFEIELENASEKYTGEFVIGNIVQFTHDYSDGTTVQFEGKIEYIQKKTTFTLNIKGSHYTGELLDITVNKEYSNSLVSDILKNLIDTYLTGYTYTNVQSSTTSISIVWKNKSLFDCILDLMKFGDMDCYVDNSKDFHLFPKNSITNENDALVWTDAIDINDLGQDAVDVKNKIVVYGESGELPVLYTSEDSSSQTTYGTKEKIIEDTSVETTDIAKSIGDAERDLNKTPPEKGNCYSYFISPHFLPGQSVYVVFPPQDITALFRLVKYSFILPNEEMDFFFSQDIGIAKLFKQRIQKDSQQERLVNPFDMKYSINFTFDDLSGLSSNSGVEIFNGNLRLQSGVGSGSIVSTIKTTPITVTKVHLKIKGEQLSGTTYKISADGTDPIQSITPDIETALTNSGNQLKIKIELTSSTTLVDSLALLYK